MRVAVHFPPDHPDSPGAVAAFNLGRIEDGVHNKLWHSGQTIPIDEFVAGMVARAQEEFPGCDVRVERLVKDGGEGRWVDADGDDDESVDAGESHDAELNVEQASDAEMEGDR